MRDDLVGLGWDRGQEGGGVELAVGVLAADLLNLGSALERLRLRGVRVLHFDLMDGRFCPDLTVGPWFVKATRTDLIKDVHLLVADPENWIEPCVRAGAGIITVHVESGTHVHRALEMITEVSPTPGEQAPLRGLGICPGSPVGSLEPHLDVADIVYVMGINPGWRQPLLPSLADRVRAIAEIVGRADRDVRVAVDGGVTQENFSQIAALRPDLVVSGSAVFANGDLESNLDRFARDGVNLSVTS